MHAGRTVGRDVNTDANSEMGVISPNGVRR